MARRIAALTALALAASAGAAFSQASPPGAAPDRAWWTTGAAAPAFEGVARRSLYVPMRDGVRLAIDLYLPDPLPAGSRFPTILEQTRYRRSFLFRPEVRDSLDRPKTDVREFVRRGYAYVIVDVRGSGASFGDRQAEFHELEVRDGKDVVDWIVAQPWSNGVVGAQGISYVGTTADLLLVNRHPAVRAVAPTFALYDAYADIVAPGGVPLSFFITAWGETIRAMDRNEVPERLQQAGILGSRPVDADTDQRELRAAVAEHADNFRVDDVVGRIVHRDDRGSNGLTVDATSPHTFRAEQVAAGAAIYSYSGWWDGGYAHAAIKRFLSVKTPGSRLVIGPWSHGGAWYWAPGLPRAIPSAFDRVGELVRFFDHHLKGIANGIEREPIIHYFTMGENRWKASSVWPVAGATDQAWYFGPDRTLRRQRPPAPAVEDRHRVDTTAATGTTSRWNTLLGGGPVVYPDRRDADRTLLTYTSEPLAAPVEVTGHPMVTLHLSSSAHDAAVFVYLEEVFDDGRVGYVTEGALRASHRAVQSDRAPYAQVPPYRTLASTEARPLAPGQPAELVFDLLPTSHQFQAGSRIRVAIAGADRDHFAMIPPRSAPTIGLHRGGALASRIVLPVVP